MTRYLTLFLAAAALFGAATFAAVGSQRVSFVEPGFAGGAAVAPRT